MKLLMLMVSVSMLHLSKLERCQEPLYWRQYSFLVHSRTSGVLTGSTGQEGSKDVAQSSDQHNKAAPASWKGLYGSQNRWRQPRFTNAEWGHHQRFILTNSLAVCGADDISIQGSPSEDVVLLASSFSDPTSLAPDEAYIEVVTACHATLAQPGILLQLYMHSLIQGR